MGAWNMRGCEKHKLMAFLAKEDMDVLGISEKWMEKTQGIPSIEGCLPKLPKKNNKPKKGMWGAWNTHNKYQIVFTHCMESKRHTYLDQNGVWGDRILFGNGQFSSTRLYILSTRKGKCL